MVKILVVEDNPSQQKLIANLLTKNHYLVATASSGVEALEKLEQLTPDLITMDVVMPGMNGFQTCRKIKDNPDTAKIPVILCSSNNAESDRYWGLKQGADAYITKPFRPDELLATIKQLLPKTAKH